MLGVAAAVPQQLRETKNRKLLYGRMTMCRYRSASCMVLKVLFAPHRRSQSHPFQTINIKANAGLKGHCMKVHVFTEPHTWSPVASSSGTHSHLWRVTPWFFEGTHLLMEYEHSCHRDTSQNCGWSGNPCQPGTTGGPPNQDC